MNQTFEQFRSYAKRVFAAVVFTIMLVGASAAALSLVSAAITTLSGVYGSEPAVVSAVSSNTGTHDTSGHPAKTDSQNGPKPTQISSTPADSEPSSVNVSEPSLIDRLNDQADHLQSPIEHSLDHGGLALGARVHQTFGRILSGVLQTLFLNSPSQTGDQP